MTAGGEGGVDSTRGKTPKKSVHVRLADSRRCFSEISLTEEKPKEKYCVAIFFFFFAHFVLHARQHTHMKSLCKCVYGRECRVALLTNSQGEVLI